MSHMPNDLTVPPKVKGKRSRREVIKPKSGLDLEELLGPREKRQKIDPKNPIPTFKQMMDDNINPDDNGKLAKPFGVMIREKLKKCVSDRVRRISQGFLFYE